MSEKVLVVCAHPDDEVLGAGGTIAKHLFLGDEVSVIFMSDGVSSRFLLKDDTMVEERRLLAFNSCASLGVNKPKFFGFSDNAMDQYTLLEITKVLEEVIEDFQPTIVYTHHSGDLNIDHRITYQAVMTACRPVPCFCVKKILTFEVLSSTGWLSSQHINKFMPNYYVDITQHWEAKVNALKEYDCEMRDFPHSRSYEAVKALSMCRGVTVGFQYAEAFFIERLLG